MARTWQVNESDCSKIHLLHGSDDNDAIWLENTWHEVSPTHAITMTDNKHMVDSNNHELTLLDGYCTTYFYKGWQTVIPLNNYSSGEIIYNKNNGYPAISDKVGREVAWQYAGGGPEGYTKYMQVVRLLDQIISLPNNMGKNLIPDLYPGALWGNNNWYHQWDMIPLLPNGWQTTAQTESFPRTFTIDETSLPGIGFDGNRSYQAPELFAPYMYLLCLRYRPTNGSYLGGIIVVMGVKKLS